MKKNLELKAVETTATNREFYDLFRPIAPGLGIVGIVAQVISGLTEALTVWRITQSELSSLNKWVAILVSIIATILVVLILEYGGRRFLQVLTRALVWKQLKNVWYKSLFVIVSIITLGIGILSFQLSTNGIKHSFVANAGSEVHFDDTALRKDYDKQLQLIKMRFNDERGMLESNHIRRVESTTREYTSKVNEQLLKADQYKQRYKKGAKWAMSYADKSRDKAAQLEIKKAAAIATVNKTHTQKLEDWQTRKATALDTERQVYQQGLLSAKADLKVDKDSKMSTALLWGNLFSYLVGFSVLLAFFCIITTEIYRRGSGIQIKYREEEKIPTLVGMVWQGILLRLDNIFRKRVERFAQVIVPHQEARSIGFNYSRPSPATIDNKLEVVEMVEGE